ncbi:acetate/propionate family kinase [Qaidamihabitans albus]|uniref:acetate/propionate family kinase n=1 Tax=Qaidamihabitans albus TaxID=2795733 RepID=UPI0018F12989|nr:acetate kinase [Qaidamihabitans albus]
MRVLTVNPGSSSLKISVLDGTERIGDLTIGDWDGGTQIGDVNDMAELYGPVDAVAVRIVHGGERTAPARLDAHTLADLERWVPLAPLHQARSLGLVRHILAALPGVPVVGGFDTAFHAGLPARAATYALPRGWREDYGIRRYGFHGLSLAHATRETARLLGRPETELGLVCCHLGAGVSVTAVDGGRSADTSMGFTPLDGVPMATRPGALDPGILLHLQRHHGLSSDEIDDALNRSSGLAGLSGTGGDIRDVLRARAAGDPDAALAAEVYLHRLRREIAAAAVSLPRVDAVVLTGGVAEHHPALRAELFAGAHFGLRVDAARNAGAGDRLISPDGVPVAIAVVGCREDLELARQAGQALSGDSAGAVGAVGAVGALS